VKEITQKLVLSILTREATRRRRTRKAKRERSRKKALEEKPAA